MKLVGFKRFKSKEGKIMALLYCTRSFASRELANAEECAGEVLEQVWLFNDLAFKVSKNDIGKKVELVTTFINGRSEVDDVNFVDVK